MSDFLLATKLYIPAPCANYVNRPSLIAKLDEGIHHGSRLTLISAPAGYGKTTLVSEWLRESQYQSVWLSLDQTDNDLVRFISYIVTALSEKISTIKHTLSLPLQPGQLKNPEMVLNPLINELAGVSGHTILVLDDYHLINAEPIHNCVTYCLEHLPPNFHLVILSRADPPLPIHLLRGRGQVNELRLKDLRFTPDEISQFIQNTIPETLSETDLSALASRTEGWIAGLQMAVISMQGQVDIPGFIHTFTGSHRYILDYLLEEVIQQQPDHIQHFLMHTSVLDRLCADLCDSVALRNDSAQLLKKLENQNLFIIPLDDHRKWYRYHRLLIDLLQQRLHQQQPTIINALHSRASQWYENQQLYAPAIHHALASRDFHRSGALIEISAETTLMRSEITTLLDWISQIPEDIRTSHPGLNFYHAWALLWNGAPLRDVEKSLKLGANDELYAAKAASLQAILAAFEGKLDNATQLANQALELLPENAIFLRNIASFIQAATFIRLDEEDKRIEKLTEVAAMSQEAQNTMTSVLVLCDLAEIKHKQGALNQAESLYKQALSLGTDSTGKHLPVAGQALCGLGSLAWERNQIEQAKEYLTRGIKTIEKLSPLSTLEGTLLYAMILENEGDKESAQALVDEMRTLAVQSDITQIDDYVVDLFDARLHFYRGDQSAVRNWIASRGLTNLRFPIQESEDANLLFTRFRKYEYPLLARYWMSEGRLDDARKLLEHQLQLAEQSSRVVLWIEAKILIAIVHKTLGDLNIAVINFKQALQKAAPEGFFRIFLNENQKDIEELLLGTLPEVDTKELTDFICRLLLAISPNNHIQLPADNHNLEADPLSPREMEVLRLLPSRLSSVDIADELFISVNTLRSHMKNIYSKLGVHSRYEAIDQAKRLGLI